jgi:hypothetical protein
MGLFKDYAYCNFEGKHHIEVEARANIVAAEYSLIINNRKIDQISGLLGAFKLRGVIQTDDAERLVVVHVKQSIFGTKFSLEIDGREVPLIKKY